MVRFSWLHIDKVIGIGYHRVTTYNSFCQKWLQLKILAVKKKIWQPEITWGLHIWAINSPTTLDPTHHPPTLPLRHGRNHGTTAGPTPFATPHRRWWRRCSGTPYDSYGSAARALACSPLRPPPKNGWLVGGFNPSQKHSSKWESSPNRG